MDHRSFGYARVSSADQNLDRQLDAFAELGLDAVYEDKASGKDFDRPGWRRLKRRLRAGDVLYVLSIDRIGRNYDEIIAECRERLLGIVAGEWRSVCRLSLIHI